MTKQYLLRLSLGPDCHFSYIQPLTQTSLVLVGKSFGRGYLEARALQCWGSSTLHPKAHFPLYIALQGEAVHPRAYIYSLKTGASFLNLCL